MDSLNFLRTMFNKARQKNGGVTPRAIVGAKEELTEEFLQYAVPKAIESMLKIPTGSASIRIQNPETKQWIRINVLLGVSINNDGACRHFIQNQELYRHEFLQYIG